MMPLINKAVPIRQGIILALSQAESAILGTVILSRNNHLSQLFCGKLAEALQCAEQSALEHGFEGYYEISGEDGLTAVLPTGLGGVFAEIKRQISVLEPRIGIGYGFTFPSSPAALAAMPAARGQLTRLIKLQDVLVKKLSSGAAA